MLHFQNQPWMLRHGVSRIGARIHPDTREPDEVHWQIDLTYANAAACWRRVQWPRRPVVALELACFKLPGRSWRSLEHANYWNLPDNEDAYVSAAGIVNTTLYLNGMHRPPSLTECGGESSWRVIQREGAIFTLELSILPENGPRPPPAESKPVLVTPDGDNDTAPSEPDPADAFWRENAELYLIEDVPFGIVTVRTPRNVRDPEAYAIARARQLIQVPAEPEHIDTRDFARPGKEFRGTSGDLYVQLYYHGYHQE